jgi:hypothetical protein
MIMSTRSRPEELIQRALDGGLVPLGTYKLRDDDGGVKTTYPKRAQVSNGVEAGQEVKKFYDQETGAPVSIPGDELHE